MAKETVNYILSDLSESHDPKKLKKGLDSIHGVISVSVSAKDNRLSVDYDSTGTDSDKITQRIRDLGFFPHHTEHQEHIM